MYSGDRYFTSIPDNKSRNDSYLNTRAKGLDLKCPQCTFIAWDHNQLQEHVMQHLNASRSQNYSTSNQLQSELPKYPNYNYSLSDYSTTNVQYQPIKTPPIPSTYFSSQLNMETTNYPSTVYQPSQYDPPNLKESISVTRNYSENTYGSYISDRPPPQIYEYDRKPIVEQSAYKPREENYYQEISKPTYYSKSSGSLDPGRNPRISRSPSRWEDERNRHYGHSKQPYVEQPSSKKIKVDVRNDSKPPYPQQSVRKNDYPPDVWCRPDPSIWQAPDVLVADLAKTSAKSQQQKKQQPQPSVTQPPTKRDQYITKIEGFYCKLCEMVVYKKKPGSQENNIIIHCKSNYHQKLFKEHLKKQEEDKNKDKEVKPSIEESKVAVEDSKVAVEDSKVATEESKVAAEESKVAAEESKVAAEEQKVSVEEQKASAEEPKVSAEEEKPKPTENQDKDGDIAKKEEESKEEKK